MFKNNTTKNFPYLIAGPCSAESRTQVLESAKALIETNKINAFRAGVWKPRTRPGHFEGTDIQGLKWLSEVKNTFNIPVITEVATPKHVEKVLKENIDMVWIGARTTSNPFSISEISNALKGVDIPVLVKNPTNPDLQLWIGAIERLQNVGIKDITAVHRGFFPYETSELRNIPKWEIVIELKTLMPNLPIFCDPSHIAGTTDKIQEIAQFALDIMIDGLMIEVHSNPQSAMTDAKQQLNPLEYSKIINNLNFRCQFEGDVPTNLEKWRLQIDSIDLQLLELLGKRLEISKKIANEKITLNYAPFQLERWKKILISRMEYANKLGLSEDYVNKILQIIHKESISIQNKLMAGENPQQ